MIRVRPHGISAFGAWGVFRFSDASRGCCEAMPKNGIAGIKGINPQRPPPQASTTASEGLFNTFEKVDKKLDGNSLENLRVFSWCFFWLGH